MEIVLRSLYIVFLIATYILYYVNIHNTVKLLSDNNKFKKISYVLAVTNIALQACVRFFFRDFELIVTRSGILLIILAVFLSHRTQLLKTVYVTLLYFSVEACPCATINLLANLVVPDDYQLVSGQIVYFIYNLTYYIVLTKLMIPRKEDLKLSLEFINRKTYLFILSYATVLSFMVAYISFASWDNTDMDTVFLCLRMFAIPICILSFVIITMLIMNSMSKFYYKRSAELLDKQLDMQARYYEKIDEMTTDIRKFRHDYKNHMHCLKSLLGSQKVDDALEYLDSISSNPTMNKTSFKSGNTIADAILNDKAAIAAQENFRLNFSGVISEKVSAFDICTILSNALDNSLEACRRLKEGEEKYIDVNCVLKNDMQMICISNPSDTDDPDLKTSKENKNEHGFGLYNIRKAVDSLDGTVNISQTSPIFVLDVMFRIKMPETA
jgi:hypothetical protein